MSSDSPIRSAPVRPWPVLLAVGPGIVLAAGVIGSGELINTPLQAARFGFVLLWAVLLSCVIKYFLQVEVGRYCLVHNQTVFEALSPFPGPRLRKTSWLVWVFMGGWLLAQVGSSGLVGAMAGLLHGIQPLSSDAIGSVQIWGVAVAVGVQLLLWRGLYGRLEKIMIGLALLLSLSAVVGLVMLQGTPFRVSGADLRSGLGFSLGETDVRLAAFAVISLIGALGVSGSELVVYPYWVLEKGYGRRLGPRDSEGWLERARGWIGILKLDAGVATLLATVVTAGYFILGAAILFPLGKRPAGSESSTRSPPSSPRATVPGPRASSWSAQWPPCFPPCWRPRPSTGGSLPISCAVWGWSTEAAPKPCVDHSRWFRPPFCCRFSPSFCWSPPGPP